MKNHFEHKEIINALLFMAALVLLSILAGKYGENHLSGLVSYVDGRGALAPVFFVLCNTVALVLVVPQTIFTIAAGLLFGTFKGIIISLAGMAAGSSLAFLLGRKILRERIIRRYSRSHYFTKIEELSRDHPLKILSLSRVVPILPYPVVNYLWAVTSVGYIPYILLSLLCILPETVFLTAGGHLLQTGLTRGRADWTIVLILLGAGAIAGFLILKMRKEFDD
jgi:uncharacterized membrane protein YdjX (TVP38/TMEM64 family)